MLAYFKKREPEQAEQERQKRQALPKKIFETALATERGADRYEAHESRTSKPVKEVESSIIYDLQTVAPKFKIKQDESPAPEIFFIEATQEFLAGTRRSPIVGGQTRDDVTKILFKVIEFKKEALVKQLVGA